MVVIEIEENGKTYVVWQIAGSTYPNPPYIKFLKNYGNTIIGKTSTDLIDLMEDSEVEELMTSSDSKVIAFREFLKIKRYHDVSDARFQVYLRKKQSIKL